MIAKKIRRTIKVDGEEYEYCITGHTSRYTCITGCVNVFIRQLNHPHRIIKWGDDWKSKWKQAITPKNIENLIKTGLPGEVR